MLFSAHTVSLSLFLRTTEAWSLHSAAEHLRVSVLLSVAASKQLSDATSTKTASVGTGAECPAQEGPGQTTQPDAERFAATLPKVLLCTGENTKHYNSAEHSVMYCTALQHSVLAEKHRGIFLNCILSCSGVELS